MIGQVTRLNEVLKQRDKFGGHILRQVHSIAFAPKPDAILRRQRAFLNAAIVPVEVFELPFQEASIISRC